MLGVLMLQTRFPRPPGDVGNPASWPMPVRYLVVEGASPQRVVRERDPALLAPFVAAGLALVQQGARAITTSCGFLFAFQHELERALPVPVWTSSLLALPELPKPGVLTVDAESLGASGLAGGAAIVGLAEGCHLQRVLLEDRPELDQAKAQTDAVTAALTLARQNPGLSHVVLECTNLPPYAAAISAATGLPVVHLMSWVQQRWSAEIGPRTRGDIG